MREELRGKTIIFDGDSICHATSETQAPERGWAYRIGAAKMLLPARLIWTAST